MQNTVAYKEGKISPATIELLIRERNNGKTVRELGLKYNRSYQRIGYVLNKHDRSLDGLLSESKVAAKLGYPLNWLVQLRKEGLIKPRKLGFWLYSEEQIRQIQSLIASARKCAQCGKPRQKGSNSFCRECHEYRDKNWYNLQSPEGKARHKKHCMAWREANPEKLKEINSRAHRKFAAKLRGLGK